MPFSRNSSYLNQISEEFVLFFSDWPTGVWDDISLWYLFLTRRIWKWPEIKMLDAWLWTVGPPSTPVTSVAVLMSHRTKRNTLQTIAGPPWFCKIWQVRPPQRPPTTRKHFVLPCAALKSSYSRPYSSWGHTSCSFRAMGCPTRARKTKSWAKIQVLLNCTA